MKLNRDKNNSSSINFHQFESPQIDPQRNRIYVCHSVVGENMKDKTKRVMKTETKFYDNRIFNTSKKYQVPVCQDFREDKSNNRSYFNFLCRQQKFVKPYGENTKFSDLLNKNQMLLRRGQFQTPLTNLRPVKLQKKNKNNRIFKYARHTTKPVFFQEKQMNSSMNIVKQNYFDKTVSTQCTVFNTLYNKQRCKKSQWIGLHNSMNRLLTAESIDVLINPQPRKRAIDV